MVLRTCPYCKIQFNCSRKFNLRSHIEKAHPNELHNMFEKQSSSAVLEVRPTRYCLLCFETVVCESLHEHCKVIHPHCLVCKICDHVFCGADHDDNEQSLAEHYRREHHRHRCHICEQVFDNLDMLNDHAEEHRFSYQPSSPPLQSSIDELVVAMSNWKPAAKSRLSLTHAIGRLKSAIRRSPDVDLSSLSKGLDHLDERVSNKRSSPFWWWDEPPTKRPRLD